MAYPIYYSCIHGIYKLLKDHMSQNYAMYTGMDLNLPIPFCCVNLYQLDSFQAGD